MGAQFILDRRWVRGSELVALSGGALHYLNNIRAVFDNICASVVCAIVSTCECEFIDRKWNYIIFLYCIFATP